MEKGTTFSLYYIKLSVLNPTIPDDGEKMNNLRQCL